MAWQKTPDGSFLDHSGKVLFFSKDRFVNDICLGRCCFICGAQPGSKVFNDEHVIPEWVLRKFDLFDRTITLPNGGTVKYGRFKVPCCQDCNSLMGRRYETSTIFSRLAFETIVSIRYLIAKFSPDLVDSYIRHSLRHERRLWDTITANIAERGGSIQHIEQRMLNSLERAARIAGITLESIDLKDRTPWGGKNLRENAKVVGLEPAYDAVFGGMSHNVHGAWQDLYQFHLQTDGDGAFTPELDWLRPRPQPLFALGGLAIDAAADFLMLIGGEAATQHVREQLEDLRTRIHSADHAHETYLSGKTWPEI